MEAKWNQVERVVFFANVKNRLVCTNFAHFCICNWYLWF